MADHEIKPITEREIREAELQMTGRPPASATGFVGFVPTAPENGAGEEPPPADTGVTPPPED